MSALADAGVARRRTAARGESIQRRCAARGLAEDRRRSRQGIRWRIGNRSERTDQAPDRQPRHARAGVGVRQVPPSPGHGRETALGLRAVPRHAARAGRGRRACGTLRDQSMDHRSRAGAAVRSLRGPHRDGAPPAAAGHLADRRRAWRRSSRPRSAPFTAIDRRRHASSTSRWYPTSAILPSTTSRGTPR